MHLSIRSTSTVVAASLAVLEAVGLALLATGTRVGKVASVNHVFAGGVPRMVGGFGVLGKIPHIL